MNNYVLNKEESNRLNILKYISIILVVYIHSYTTNVNFAEGFNGFQLPLWLSSLEYFISQIIARCAVPMFFLISSILLFKTKRNYKKTIVNKFKTIVIPYFFWNTFWILIFILLQSLSFTAPFFSGNSPIIINSSFSQWLGLYGIGFSFPFPQAYQLWFLRDLIIVTLFFPIIGKIAKKFPKILLISSIILLILPFHFQLKQAILWFCIGACLINLKIHITIFDNISMWKYTILYILCAIITLIVNHTITDNLFIFIGIIYWIKVSKYILNHKKIKNIFIKLSKWTFIIYVMHELTLTSLKKLCLKILPTEPIWILIEYLLLPIIVIALCSIIGALFKKIIPKLYSISTGSR